MDCMELVVSDSSAPRTTSWAILSRSYGTRFGEVVLTHSLKAVPFRKLSSSATCEAVPFVRRISPEVALEQRRILGLGVLCFSSFQRGIHPNYVKVSLPKAENRLSGLQRAVFVGC